MRKKIKTSVSICRKTHEAICRIAKAQDRSVSYILEKFIEERAALPISLPIWSQRKTHFDRENRPYQTLPPQQNK
jgi:hypothetical protein